MKSHPHRDYSGLLPKKGWGRRNISYWKNRVIPEVWKPRNGEIHEIDFSSHPDVPLRLIWIGHASFLLQFGSTSLIIDPNWAMWHGPVKRLRQPGLELNSIPILDAILVTHAHFDHLHRPSLKILQSKNGIIIPNGNRKLVSGLGFKEIHEMAMWQSFNVNNLEIIHTPALHWGARYIHDTFRQYGGYFIRSNNLSVLHCGDSAWFDGFLDIAHHVGKIDVAILPIGAYGAPSGRNVHMNPEEAIRAFLTLNARYFVPMHYGTFPLGTEPANEPLIRLLQEAARQDILDRILIPEEGIPLEWQDEDLN